MIDLHIHSIHSDGTDSVEEILKKAEKNKLEVISITDHDSTNAYNELEQINIEQYYKGKIIKGCEFKCIFSERKLPIEILGYGINTKQLKNDYFINKSNQIQSKYLEILKKIGKSIGLIFDNDLSISNDKIYYAGAVFEKEIEKYEENKKILKENNIIIKNNFYREMQCNPNSIFYIYEKDDYQKAKEIIDLIHNLGGLAFIAHPYIYPINDTIIMLKEFIETNQIDGVEGFYSLYTKQETENIVNFCKENKLYISGGSDYHGKNKSNIEIGVGTGNLKIDKNIINDWVNKII